MSFQWLELNYPMILAANIIIKFNLMWVEGAILIKIIVTNLNLLAY